MAAETEFWAPMLRSAFFTDTAKRLSAGETGVTVSGLIHGSRALLVTLLLVRLRRALLVVAPDDAATASWHRDLVAVARLMGRDPARVVSLPALDCDPYDGIPPHPEVLRERVVALSRMHRGCADIVVVPARTLLQWVPSPQEWGGWLRALRTGQSMPSDLFVSEALGLGYRRVDTVTAPGEVSRRGGIIDIFPPDLREPVRIELFGDTVESLRSFDTDHQRSTGRLEAIEIGPAQENPPTAAALERLGVWLEHGRSRLGDDGNLLRELRARLDALRDQGYWPGLEALAALSAERPTLLFEHLPGAALIVDEPEQSDQALVRAAHDSSVAWEQSGERILPPPERLFVDAAAVRERLAQPALWLHELAGVNERGTGTVHHVACRSGRAYAGRLAEFTEDLRSTLARGSRAVCVMRAEGSTTRLVEILEEYQVPAAAVSGAGVVVITGGLRAGFELPEVGLSVLTEREIFGEQRRPAERKTGGRAAFIADFRDLEPGNLVVHVDHGVARYAGLGRPQGGSLNRDFMVLEFAAGDRLFVPVDRLDLVQRYSGVAGSRPQLDRLGGPGWERVKSKVRKSVESMAKELLELYARRKAATGHACGPDTPWQRELEDAFPFELTPDQERAMEEVKADMESTRVMDRLLVGDVGFGKTEIAIRAAFKAVMDGRQVAMLAPTTVLCTQHLETVRARFAPFPVRVEAVSRFRPPAEVRSVLRDAAAGSVDVLIGTHRILSADVRFAKLGLLVVDEEQRFGVAHKERLKQLSEGVDVLSLTATPIPRTLQMSLAGVRDLSVIETPPAGRMAIQTYLVPFRKNVVAQAIRQELARNGQVFFVHPRIETLPALAQAIGRLVPDARIVTAHGRMPEHRLEEAMLRFVRHEADILVTTKIIENGLDIPRANTILINRADRFGLAELYQLRGRVGRSRHHAYAYYLIPGRNLLSDEAQRRLRTLQEFSDLGAGFRLAAADLEIRGAGELLGSRQHGHIASLGFDLYCQMLERAVQELQGGGVEVRTAPTLHLGVDIKVPPGFLPEERDRLALYKRIAQTRDEAEIDRLMAETEDRFGALPAPAVNLFEMARLRLVAEGLGVKSVDLVADTLQLRFHERPPVEPERVLQLLHRVGGALTPSGMLQLPAPPQGSDRILAVRELLRQMSSGK